MRTLSLGFGLLLILPTLALAGAPQKPDGFELGGDAGQGKGDYVKLCASCHGVQGDGNGPAGKALDPKPADFTDAERMGRVSDWELYVSIRDGGLGVGLSPIMPAWKGALSDDQIRDVAAYVRTFSD